MIGIERIKHRIHATAKSYIREPLSIFDRRHQRFLLHTAPSATFARLQNAETSKPHLSKGFQSRRRPGQLGRLVHTSPQRGASSNVHGCGSEARRSLPDRAPRLAPAGYWRREGASGPGLREPNKPCWPPAGAAAKYRVPGSPPLPRLPHCRPHSPSIAILLPFPSCIVPR